MNDRLMATRVCLPLAVAALSALFALLGHTGVSLADLLLHSNVYCSRCVSHCRLLTLSSLGEGVVVFVYVCVHVCVCVCVSMYVCVCPCVHVSVCFSLSACRCLFCLHTPASGMSLLLAPYLLKSVITFPNRSLLSERADHLPSHVVAVHKAHRHPPRLASTTRLLLRFHGAIFQAHSAHANTSTLGGTARATASSETRTCN